MARSKVRYKVNSAATAEMLKSSGVEGLVMSQAERVAANAGAGYEATLGTQGKTRARAWVRTETFEAMRDNARNATLLRALGGA